MRKFFVLALLFVVMFCVNVYAQYDDPAAYTTYYGYRMWSAGANPGADSLNQNWKDIDQDMYNLRVFIDPRYFSWLDSNKDTLTLNTYAFGTIAFDNGENLYLPYHDSPYSNLGGSAIAYATGGWFVLRNSAQSRIDTMASQYWVRQMISSGQTINTHWTFTDNVTMQGSANTIYTLSVKDRIYLPILDGASPVPNYMEFGGIYYNSSYWKLGYYRSSGVKDTVASEEWTKSYIDDYHESISNISAIYFADSSYIINLDQNVESRITNAGNNLFSIDNSIVNNSLSLSGDTLHVAQDGDYIFDISMSFGGGALGLYEIYTKTGGTENSKYKASRATSNSDFGNFGFHALLNLSAGDAVTFWVINTGSSTEYTARHGNIIIEQVR